MSNNTAIDLEGRIEFLERKLDLIDAIDRIGDEAEMPSQMLASVVQELSKRFDLDCCLLGIVSDETHQFALATASGSSVLAKRLTPEHLEKLANLAQSANGVAVGPATDLLNVIDCGDLPDNLVFAVVAIELAEKPLGVLLLTRRDHSFSNSEVELLKTAENYLDSALVQCNVQHELARRNRELETIYRVDHIRDLHLPFDQMLQAALDELCSLVESEMGFIMLYDHDVQHMRIAAVKLNVELSELAAHFEIGDLVAHKTLEVGELICRNDMDGGVHSVMCIPLILDDEIIGVFGLINRMGKPGFTMDDRRLMNAVGSQMDTAIFEVNEVRQLKQVLGRSVDPRVLSRALAQRGTDLLKGERLVISVLYADIRGSTELAESTDPELFVGFIKDYLGRMAEVVFNHEGTVDKFVGDEVMALFGAPFPQDDHALRAIRAGLDMQRMYQTLIESWQAQGIRPVTMGVGIATGELLVGEIGSAERSDYTAIGRAANLGARICSAAAGGEVLISEETYRQAQASVAATAISGLQMKGLEKSVTAYRVERLRS